MITTTTLASKDTGDRRTTTPKMKTTRLDTSNEVTEATTMPSPNSWPTELPTRPGTTTEIEDLITIPTTTIAPKANQTTTTSSINPCTVDTNCAPNEHCKLGRCQKKGIHST